MMVRNKQQRNGPPVRRQSSAGVAMVSNSCGSVDGWMQCKCCGSRFQLHLAVVLAPKTVGLDWSSKFCLHAGLLLLADLNSSFFFFF
jgi:hypothetical protein